jgi:MOSC domain-containing protein YiiM
MKVLSVNVGTPREVEWRSDVVETAIYKTPVSGPIIVRRLNLDGDRQADLSVHGGPEKAVYVYPSEHYDYWREELPGMSDAPALGRLRREPHDRGTAGADGADR